MKNLAFKVWLEDDNLTKTGKFFDRFTSQVTQGTFGKSTVPYQLAHPIGKAGYAHDEMQKHMGHFDDHIAKSIPTFREVQVRKAHAIVRVFGNQPSSIIDIGGDEGSLNKTVSALSKGNIQSTVLDPNAEMASFFNSRSQVPGSKFVQKAFISGWQDDSGQQIDSLHADNHLDRYDIAHENMTFQFINNNRTQHIQEVKRLLKPNGVLITQEKLITAPDQWKSNEMLKDREHKNIYYSADDLAAKQKVVGVSFQQEKPDPNKVNMVDNMVKQEDFERILSANFHCVIQFWDAGNFKGYVASDNAVLAQRLVMAMGNLNSKFSTTSTPRRVK